MPYPPIGPRQRRMWVLPAPKGGLDKSDRYALGIFYALRFLLEAIGRPSILFRSPFRTDDKKPMIFKSEWEKNIFTSARKQRKSN